MMPQTVTVTFMLVWLMNHHAGRLPLPESW